MNHRNFNLLLIVYFSFSISIILSGCSKKNILSEDKFVKVYADIIIAQDTTSLKDVSTDSLKEIIFKKHNITAEEYKSTIDYYNQNPEKWEKFFNKAVAYLQELRKQKIKK